MRIAKIGLLLDRDVAARRRKFGLNAFEAYLGEVLEHRGIAFEWIDRTESVADSGFDIVLVALAADTQEGAEALWTFAERGGLAIVYGGMLHKLAAKLGCGSYDRLGCGYAHLEGTPYAEGEHPLRFLEALPWTAAPAAAVSQTPEEEGQLSQGSPYGPTIGTALQRFRVGAGTLERWSVAIPATIAGLQQGLKPVLEDGIPAGDGTIPINDHVLKADDGAETDWRWDRAVTDEGAAFFAYPYADLWREAAVRHLLHAALERGCAVPFLAYWPEGVSHVALLSLDSDHTGDLEGETTFQLLQECGIPATWCMMEKEYSRPMYDRIVAASHELALHYNAVWQDNGSWGAEEFRRQANWFRATTGQNEIVSNKNHVTRWEGWGELFRFHEDNGIQSDQSRGGSKKGNNGFLFGTCQPYFPIAWAGESNRLYDVLEIGFLFGDFLQLDTGVIEPLLEQVRRVEGVAHFVFHPIHIHRKEAIRDWLRKWAAAAAAKGFAFWTGAQINDWHRLRRSLRIAEAEDGGIRLKPANTGFTGAASGAAAAGSDAEPGRRPSLYAARGRTGAKAVVWLPVGRQDRGAHGGAEADLHPYAGLLCRRIVIDI